MNPVKTTFSAIKLQPYIVEQFLHGLKRTSSGHDNIPFWVYKKCSFELAEIIACIFNCSIDMIGCAP